jgi:hypothetical protein
MAFMLIPDPNEYLNVPWPHKWIYVYCNHALLLVHADQAEEGCHPGPESRAFMADLQMLATYPIYGIILNVIPYTYPAIAGFLVVAAIPEQLWQRTAKARIRPNGDLILDCLILFLILFTTYYIMFL